MATERYLDVLKQGFTKPRTRAKVREPLPYVACEKCCDWHVKGKHRKAAK